MAAHRFPRAARLKQRRLIRALFDRRRTDVHHVALGSVRLVYRVLDGPFQAPVAPVQVGFAPGRRAGNAVRRNRIKRLMREVYRVQQHELVDLFSRSARRLTLMVLFRGDPATAPEAVPKDLKRALDQLSTRLRDHLGAQ
ncbi:MAG: ribonuclease P protein component [Rhodothermales bacterium]